MTTTTSSPAARARSSTIFLKLTMALSGLVFIGFVLLHMYGNLKAFAGQESFDAYAEHLREIGEPILPYGGLLWITRIALILALLVHLRAAFTLWARNQKARPQGYERRKAFQQTLSSRTMRWGGVTLLLFIVWHLLQFTFRAVTPGGDSDSPYDRLVNAFQPEQWWVVVVYLLAMAALTMHLRHGTWSSLQTMGLTGTPAKARVANLAAYAVATVIGVGFAVIPLSIVVGIIE